MRNTGCYGCSSLPRRAGETDERVAWAKPARRPTPPPAWLTPKVLAVPPAVLCVRTLHSRVTHAGLRTQTVPLVTTLVDVDLYPANAWSPSTGWRQVATTRRHLTQTMGLDVLRCKRPVGVRQDLTVCVRVYPLVGMPLRVAAQLPCPGDARASYYYPFSGGKCCRRQANTRDTVHTRPRVRRARYALLL